MLQRELDGSDKISEPGVARKITQLIPGNHVLFSASSMPIRDLDMFANPDSQPVPFAANRGASGIDGTVASAIGFSRGHHKPVTLLIGDLALLHDLNSLAFIKNYPEQVIIVVINNDGGGIFSFLPVPKHTEHFETCFGTPHGFNFEGAASQFGLNYIRPSTMARIGKNLPRSH